MQKSVDDIISEIVKAKFADAEIDSIEIEPDEDSDGDPILRITVVFSSEIADIESNALVGLTRHIRPKLIEQSNPRFPIFSFISKRDNDRIRHEAA